MKILRGFLCLAVLMAGLMLGRWIADEPVARTEAERAWKQQDVEGCFKALTRVAQTSPTHAFELLLSLEGDETKAIELLQRLTKEFPDAGVELMAVFLLHPEHYRDYTMGREVFCGCARADPERAWQAMMAHEVQFMPAFLPDIARGMTQRAPLEAMRYAAKIPCPMHRESFVHEVMQEWSERDGQGLLSWLRAQPDEGKLARHVGWFQLKITDAAQLAAIADLMPESFVTDRTSFSVGLPRPLTEGAWMQHTEWLLALPAGEKRTLLCTAAARGLVPLDPEAALKLLPEVKDTNVSHLVTSAVSAFRAAVSPQEGLAFANSLTDPMERRNARNSVFITWAENDPAGASLHALESGDPDAKIMLSHAGFRWAMDDPENACRFALEHEKPSEGSSWSKNAMLKSAVNIWAGKEPVAAARWAKALPEGGAKDAAFYGVAKALSFRQPEQSLRWAQDIQDAAMRRQALQLCLMSWLYKDNEKPVKWLQQASLDDETRKALDAYVKSRVAAARPGQAESNGRYISDAISIFR